ncbi:MAG TPA: hypothetical protein PKW75_04065 [candidate division Zixibacteria bacterium]|nr:hypothetical protein [candidate division Zixibacteria bacterium]MDD4918579.1 hypothetical protein [candidate division Zixibacteria bacterium]MDM7971972.1 hypothetical protein [candidate division Zixibacteria bacterium]HOD65639.1 hypothetical protein [candidate division Zixibacteria bacterium]HOZ07443.1 hypothetical protein [candidate division Zixibacteria bacterium]
MLIMGSVALVSVAVADTTHANIALEYGDLKGSGGVEIVGEPKLGEPFDVVFRFTPVDSFSHSKGIPDTVLIRGNPGVEFVGGDTLWIGSLTRCQTVELKARFVIRAEIKRVVTGWVHAAQTLGQIIPPQFGPNAGVDVGRECVAQFRSKPIDFRQAEENDQISRLWRLKVTDTGLILADTAASNAPSELKRHPVIDSLDQTNRRGTRRPRQLHGDGPPILRPRQTTPINLSSESPDTIRIAYDPTREVEFFTDSAFTGSVRVFLLEGNAVYTKSGARTGVFELKGDSGRALFRVEAGSLERILLVHDAAWY